MHFRTRLENQPCTSRSRVNTAIDAITADRRYNARYIIVLLHHNYYVKWIKNGTLVGELSHYILESSIPPISRSVFDLNCNSRGMQKVNRTDLQKL